VYYAGVQSSATMQYPQNYCERFRVCFEMSRSFKGLKVGVQGQRNNFDSEQRNNGEHVDWPQHNYGIQDTESIIGRLWIHFTCAFSRFHISDKLTKHADAADSWPTQDWTAVHAYQYTGEVILTYKLQLGKILILPISQCHRLKKCSDMLQKYMQSLFRIDGIAELMTLKKREVWACGDWWGLTNEISQRLLR
jgi:hypothetical protein